MHNVTAAELGAVLFALTHGGDPAKPYRHMMGRGKPFGAGQTRVNSARLVVTPNDPTAESLIVPPEKTEEVSDDDMTGFCPAPTKTAPSHSHIPFLEAFCSHMQKTKNTYPEISSVREFLGASNPALTEQMGSDSLETLNLDDFATIRDAYKCRKDGKPPLPITSANQSVGETIAPKRLLPAPAIAQIRQIRKR